MKSYKLKEYTKYYIGRVASNLYHNLFARYLSDRYYPYKFPGGKIYLNVKESPMMLERILGVYERRKVKIMKSFLKPGMTFIDVGANKGDFSLIAAKIMNDEGTVLAFEPEPTNCLWVKKSIELNRYKGIRLFEFALGDSNQSAKLYLGEKSGWHSLIPSLPSRNMGVIEVQKRTLDPLLQEIRCKKVDMMKIDVEGFEMNVLKGAYNTLMNNHGMTLLLDLHPYLGVDSIEVCNFIKGLGYELYEMKNGKRIVEARKDLDEVLAVGSDGSFNAE